MKKVLMWSGAGLGAQSYGLRLDDFDQVTMIEPIPVHCRFLRDKFGHRCDIVEGALVAEMNKDRVFKVRSPAHWSGFSEPTGLLDKHPSIRLVKKLDVPQIGVKTLLARYEDAEITFLLDCCGDELEMIEAALKSVPHSSRIAAVLVATGNGFNEFTTSVAESDLVNLLEDRAFLRCEAQVAGGRKLQSYQCSREDELERFLAMSNERVAVLEAEQNRLEAEQDRLEAELKHQEQLFISRLDEIQLHLKSGGAESAKQLQTLEESLTKKIRVGNETAVRQVESYLGVRDFLRDGTLGMNFHGWPISSEIALYLLRLIYLNNYSAIIEFGSGTSTLMFAKVCSGELGGSGDQPSVLSLEHHPKFYAETRGLLEAEGLHDRVSLIHAPLIDTEIDGRAFSYYDCEAALSELADKLSEGSRVLVLVDGPPQQTGDWARYPALPLLLRALGQTTLDIIVDDYARKVEMEIVTAWEQLLDEQKIGYQGERVEAEKGAYLLTVNPTPTS